MHNICLKPFRCGDNSCVTIILHLELYRHLQADCQNSQEIIYAIFCVEQDDLYIELHRRLQSRNSQEIIRAILFYIEEDILYIELRRHLQFVKNLNTSKNNMCNILHITSYIEQNKANLMRTRLTLAASGTLLGQTAVNLSLLEFQLL